MKEGLYIFIILISIYACNSAPQEKAFSSDLISCEIEVQDSIVNAGQSVAFSINCSIADNDSVILILSNSLSENIFPVGIKNGSGSILIDGDLMKQSGIVSYCLYYGGKCYNSGRLTVMPGETKGLIETFAGPKTIVAGGIEEAMIIGIPLDSFGNVVKGSEIQFGLVTPENISKSQRPVISLTAYEQYKSGNTSGKWYLGAEARAANSLEENVYVVPSMPTDFMIEKIQSTPYADGRTVSIISTDILKDLHNNTVSDGTIVRFLMMEDEQIVSSYQSQTIGGIARLYFEHPERSMNISAQAYIDGLAKSNVLNLSFLPIMKQLTASYSYETKRIIVGPLRGVFGQYVPDGFKVSFHISGPDYDDWIFLKSERGKCVLILADHLFDQGNYNADIYAGGLITNIEFEWE